MEASLKNIKSKVALKDKTMKWLMEQMEMGSSTFYNKCHTKFTKSEKFHMSHLLGVEFE